MVKAVVGRWSLVVGGLLLSVALTPTGQAQISHRPKVRAITAFVRLDTKDYRQQLAATAQSLGVAKKKFGEKGWEVETVRITMQPFPEFVHGLAKDKALALMIDLDSLASGNFDINVCPAMMRDLDVAAMMVLLVEFLARAKVTNSNAI